MAEAEAFCAKRYANECSRYSVHSGRKSPWEIFFLAPKMGESQMVFFLERRRRRRKFASSLNPISGELPTRRESVSGICGNNLSSNHMLYAHRGAQKAA